MSWLQTIILAFVEGLTEIFPVSGDAHTLIFLKLLGVSLTAAQICCVRAWMHFGVFLALCLYYRRELRAMLEEFLVLLGIIRPVSRRRGIPLDRRQLMLYLFAALPVIAGALIYPLRRRIEQGRFALAISGLLLGLFGLILYFAFRGASPRREDDDLTLGDTLSAGASQIISVLPGVSRSGAVTAVAVSRGVTFPGAVRMAGIMGVPVFLAAGIVDLIAAKGAAVNAAVCILAFCVTALTAMFALRLLRGIARRGSMSLFVYWCWGAGIFSLALFLISA